MKSSEGSYRGSALLYIEYRVVDSGLSRQLEVILIIWRVFTPSWMSLPIASKVQYPAQRPHLSTYQVTNIRMFCQTFNRGYEWSDNPAMSWLTLPRLHSLTPHESVLSDNALMSFFFPPLTRVLPSWAPIWRLSASTFLSLAIFLRPRRADNLMRWHHKDPGTLLSRAWRREEARVGIVPYLFRKTRQLLAPGQVRWPDTKWGPFLLIWSLVGSSWLMDPKMPGLVVLMLDQASGVYYRQPKPKTWPQAKIIKRVHCARWHELYCTYLAHAKARTEGNVAVIMVIVWKFRWAPHQGIIMMKPHQVIAGWTSSSPSFFHHRRQNDVGTMFNTSAQSLDYSDLIEVKIDDHRLSA